MSNTQDDSRLVRLLFLSLVFSLTMTSPTQAFLTQKEKTADRGAQRDKDAAAVGSQAVNAQAGGEAEAVSTSPLALPFKRLWHYADDVTTLPPTLDETRIYLPLVGGRLVCLAQADGAKLWSSDLGGVITTAAAVTETAVLVATRKLAADGSEAGATIRALDKTTGLTLWTKDYARPFTSPLVPHQGRIYAGSADGAFYALAAAGGDMVWKVATQDVVRGRALVTDNAIYFGSDDGALRGVEFDRGQEVFKFQTAGKVVGAPVADAQALYFGSGDGYLYAVVRATGKLRWRSRTGAAIEASPTLIDAPVEGKATEKPSGKAADKAADHERGRLLVASFDNFVYALSRASGDRLWKRRLESRLSAAPLVVGDAALIAPLRSDYVAIFLHEDGRRVNAYRLEREMEIVAEPLFANNLLLLSTNKGLLVATPTLRQVSGVR